VEGRGPLRLSGQMRMKLPNDQPGPAVRVLEGRLAETRPDLNKSRGKERERSESVSRCASIERHGMRGESNNFAGKKRLASKGLPLDRLGTGKFQGETYSLEGRKKEASRV